MTFLVKYLGVDCWSHLWSYGWWMDEFFRILGQIFRAKNESLKDWCGGSRIAWIAMKSHEIPWIWPVRNGYHMYSVKSHWNMDDYSPIGSWNIYEFYWHISMIHHDSPIESSQNGNTCQYIPILSQVWSLSGHYLVIMQLYPHDIPTKNIPVLSPLQLRTRWRKPCSLTTAAWSELPCKKTWAAEWLRSSPVGWWLVEDWKTTQYVGDYNIYFNDPRTGNHILNQLVFL